MRRKILLTIPQVFSIIIILILFTTITVLAAAGTTDAANAPGLSSSYTLEDIYQRLVNGTAGTQSTFSEPAVASGTGSMVDLNDIMNAAPQLETGNVATADQVLSGTTFWGLSAGEWGWHTGTMPSGSDITGVDGNLTFDIPDGAYSGKTASAADSDLLAANIHGGANIFGVEGEAYGGCTCEGSMVGTTGTRWCDNGDGTITDMLGYNGYGKCLVWLQDAGCLGEKPWTGDDNAHITAGFLISGQCGLTDASNYGDWRLPTSSEIEALVNGTDPVLSSSPQGFIAISPNPYWSNRGNGSDGVWAFTRNLQSGVSTIYQRIESHYVWPVRNIP